MGRPKKDSLSIRSKELRIRLTETEYYWIKQVAEKQKKDMSELLRFAFFEYVRTNYSNDDVSIFASKVYSLLKENSKKPVAKEPESKKKESSKKKSRK